MTCRLSCSLVFLSIVSLFDNLLDSVLRSLYRSYLAPVFSVHLRAVLVVSIASGLVSRALPEGLLSLR